MLDVDRSNTGRRLKRLEQAGYVERSGGNSDKRTYLVNITRKGRKAPTELSKLKMAMARDFFGDMSQGEASKVLDLLNQIPAETQDR